MFFVAVFFWETYLGRWSELTSMWFIWVEFQQEMMFILHEVPHELQVRMILYQSWIQNIADHWIGNVWKNWHFQKRVTWYKNIGPSDASLFYEAMWKEGSRTAALKQIEVPSFVAANWNGQICQRGRALSCLFFFCHLFMFISWSSMHRNEHLHVGCWVVWPVHTCTILYFSNCPFIQSLVSTVVFDWGNLESQTSHVFLSGCLAFGVAARRPVGIAGVNQKFLRYRALSVNDNDTDQNGL